MKFKSDKQRRAMFANMGRFSSKPTIEGYTGSKIEFDETGADYPIAIDPYGGRHEVGNTVVLPGVDYKRRTLDILAKDNMGLSHNDIQLSDEENLDLVRKMSGAERMLLGRPVYSSVPKKTTCVMCGRVLDAMDVFPGNVCLSCYERAFDGVGTEEQKLQEFNNDWNSGMIR